MLSAPTELVSLKGEVSVRTLGVLMSLGRKDSYEVAARTLGVLMSLSRKNSLM